VRIAVAVVVSALIPVGALTDRTVVVGDASIRVRCGGARLEGQPLVVLESGAGNGAETWARVQPEIAEFARVCAYDRPGLVRNAPPPPATLTPTPDAMIRTLDGVLNGAGEPPPYVLVGHSLGGMIVRLYAARFPDRVAGMVLIDSSHEDQLRRFAALNPAQAASPPPATRFEAFDLPALSEALSIQPWHASIPLAVLTRAGDANDANYRVWTDLQNELATRSPRASHVTADRSGHYIQNDRPDLVIAAVRQVLRR
jgi:pimeloyl-ACP methyl ester carboxylesterase